VVDVFSKDKRTEIMKSIKSKNTKLELKLRSAIWKSGLRYRVYYVVDGVSVDIVFPSKKIAVFIDGCFWHGCKKCRNIPKTNKNFWKNKIEKTKIRDKKNDKKLRKKGWHVLHFWEHEINKDIKKVIQKITITLKSFS